MFDRLSTCAAVLLLHTLTPLTLASHTHAAGAPVPAVKDTAPAPASAPQPSDVFPAVGEPAPQLAVQHWLNVPAGQTPWAAGKTTTFGDGHVYVLDFTATWCEGCPARYPMMDTLQQKYAARGLRVLYVTALWGFQGEPPGQQLSTLRQYITDHHLTAPVAVFADAAQFAKSGYFRDGAYELPMTLLIDGAGTVRTALDDHDGFLRAVEAAVAAPRPSHSALTRSATTP